jgi:hypothetical protein
MYVRTPSDLGSAIREQRRRLNVSQQKLGHVDERGVVHEPDADELRFGQRGRSPWSAEHEGFSVHAGVTVKRGDADGHLLLDPVQFMARLASLIPPPRHPLVRHCTLCREQHNVQ